MSDIWIPLVVAAVVWSAYELSRIKTLLTEIRTELQTSDGRSLLEQIRNGLCDEFEKTPEGTKLTEWGVKELLKDILGELRSK